MIFSMPTRREPSGTLELDADAKTLGAPPIGRNSSKRRSPGRHAPDGPGGESVEAWQRCWNDNQTCLFFSEAGGYRRQVDPLAKKRRIPSKELRGPARASQPQSGA